MPTKPAPSTRTVCVSSGVRGGCAPVESSAGLGFATCAGKHYFVIGTKAALKPFWRTHASVPSGLPP